MNLLKKLVILLGATFLLAGCAGQGNVPIERLWASVEGGQINSPEAGEEFYFTVPIDPAMLGPEPDPINIKVSGQVSSGELTFELRDPAGQMVWDTGLIGPGDFSMQTAYAPTQAGDYKLGLVYSAGISAMYNLSWHALSLTPGIFMAGAGMLLVSLVFLAYSRRMQLTGRYLAMGAFIWVITVALKFAFAVPISPIIYRALGISQTDLFSPANLLAYIYIGSLTGIFEAGVTYLILSRFAFGRASWRQALAFGIGFGVVEALILAVGSLATAASGYFAPEMVPPYALASLVQGANPLFGLAPAVERLSVILAHIFAGLLIFYAIARREAKWAWAAILYKTILDIPAGFAAFWGTNTFVKLWTIEAVVAVLGFFGLLGSIWISQRYQEHDADQATQAAMPEVQEAEA